MRQSPKYGVKDGGVDDIKVKNIKEKINNVLKDEKFKMSKRIEQALSLPTLCNMNPRSVYNKLEEFHTFVKEEELDVIFLSESWEREYLTLDKVIRLEDHTVISNVSQEQEWVEDPQ